MPARSAAPSCGIAAQNRNGMADPPLPALSFGIAEREPLRYNSKV